MDLKTFMLNTTNPVSEANIPISVPSENQMARNKSIIRQAFESHLLSEAGMNWLVLASDPWHDNKVDNFKGIPDSSVGNSVVMSVTQEIS